jgi:hypothetical protein
MPMFCRHNRLTANCPICSRELQAELKSKAPISSSRPRSSSTRSRSGGTTPRRAGVVTKRLARAADDGYRNALVPGLRATADAERLAAALTAAAARLEPPGPYPELATEPDVEEATWQAFLHAHGSEEQPSWASGGSPDRTAEAYRAWASRCPASRARSGSSC